MLKLLIQSKKRFDAEDGTATIEAVLWLPLFLFGFTLAFDAAVMFTAETEALRVVQNANRLASISRLDDAAATETYVETTLNGLSPNATATSTISVSGVIQTAVTIPASDLGILGFFPQLADINLSVSADHMLEDFL